VSDVNHMLDGAWDSVVTFAAIAGLGWAGWVVLTITMAGLVWLGTVARR
jgi:hypothetical protein